MKLDINQPILDIDGSPLPKEVSQDAERAYNKALQSAEKVVGAETSMQILKQLEKDVNSTKLTLRDVAMRALRIADQSDSVKDKDDAFDIMLMLTADKPDIDKKTAQSIYEKIRKSYQDNVIIGRCRQILVDNFGEEDKKSTKKKS